MSSWELLQEKKGEFGPWLRRSFWLPLRHMLRMFHILPVTAALIVFVLLAADGQLREIYVSYLEDLGSADPPATVLRFTAAAVGFALISAVLYESHYLLSTARINVIYSINSELAAQSMLPRVQEATAIVLALSPWLGLTAGLLHAKIYLAVLFATLQKAGALDIASMQHVPMSSDWAIVAAVLVLGLVMALLVAANPKSRTLQRAVIIATPPAAAVLLLLLVISPQVNLTNAQIVEFDAAIIAAVVLYYFVYTRLSTVRALVFSPSLQRGVGVNLRGYHRLLMFAWAILPWVVAIALYFKIGPPAPKSGLHSWAMIPVAMSWVVAIGLFVVLVLHHYRETPRLKWTLYAAVGLLALAGLLVSWLPANDIVTVYRSAGPLASMALALLFLISILALLAVLSQRSGFPALTLVVLALVGIVLLPIPVGWTVGLLTILCLGIFVVAVVARLGAVAGVAIILALTGGINFAKLHGIREVSLRTSAGAKPLKTQFVSWLNRAETPPTAFGRAQSAAAACAVRFAGNARRYPAFIIAVEGGGIYAASAASMFLARLQDHDPCFVRHVFAISAVSGGAIGATVFEALEQAALDRAAAVAARPAPTVEPSSGSGAVSDTAASSNGCLPLRAASARGAANDLLEMEVCAIIEDDHFSPLVASIFPELLGFTRSGRAQELSASFDDSVKAHDAQAGQILDEPFDTFASNWSKAPTAPALVLNSTWVETGYRAAFAPFPLHAIDGSLYSFADQNMPDDNRLTLINAAVVSARFPAVLPPYSLLIRKNRASKDGKSVATGTTDAPPLGTMRWNFVDGGYSDTSGAATALALYNALKSAAAKHNAVLRVILLTSSDPRLAPDDINGTAFADTLGPIDAMLSVRNGLGNEAVARACDGILGTAASVGRASACEDSTGVRGSPIQIVGIDAQTYGLSLGWKISRTSFGVVSWMLGEPQFARAKACTGQAPSTAPTPQVNGHFKPNRKVVCANSLVEADILQSLK
jgi:hypothetical protein